MRRPVDTRKHFFGRIHRPLSLPTRFPVRENNSPARRLRLEALRIHKELLDRFSIEETREIIRHLTMIEAVLTREEDEPPLKEGDET